MDLQLREKVALVTGASRGLGRASAEALGAEGAYVMLAARDERRLAEVADGIKASGGTAAAIRMDLLDAASIAEGVHETLALWGRIDILIANAPGPKPGKVMDLTQDDWRTALDANVLSMVRLVEAVVPGMREQRSGRIVFIATVGVLIAQPAMVLSNATRLAVLGLAKTMALELADVGILVNVLCPGPIETDRMVDLVADTAWARGVSIADATDVWLTDVPLGRMGKPEDFGSIVAFVASEACSFMTGAAIAIDGGKAKGY